VRDRHAIDSELRLLAAVWRVAAEHGAVPSIGPVDELVDERREAPGA
jgi:hypothetical protein